MFTLAETRWWHLKQVDDGVPVLRDLSKQRGSSERTTDAENFVSDAQHEVRLEALLRPSLDGRGLLSMGAASTVGFMCRRDGALLTKPSQPLSLTLVGVHFVCIDGVSSSGIAVIAVQGRGRGDSWPRPRCFQECQRCPRLTSRGRPAELRHCSSALRCRLCRPLLVPGLCCAMLDGWCQWPKTSLSDERPCRAKSRRWRLCCR